MMLSLPLPPPPLLLPRQQLYLLQVGHVLAWIAAVWLFWTWWRMLWTLSQAGSV